MSRRRRSTALPWSSKASTSRLGKARRGRLSLPCRSEDPNSETEGSTVQKRLTSPVAQTAKRMKLLVCEETTEERDCEWEEEPTQCDEDEEEEMIVDKTNIETSSDDSDFYADENLKGTEDGPSDPYERMVCFRKLSQTLLNMWEMKPLKEPCQLTKRCRGVGKASEVWSVLCHKDDIHSIRNANFLNPHQINEDVVSRATLIDWIQEVCAQLRLHRETFHLTVDYIDRFLAKGPSFGIFLRISEFQLLGTTALFVASKYEEIYPPKVDELVMYTDDACTLHQVLRLETQLLKVLEWELNVVSPLQWIQLYLELLSKPPTGRNGSLILSDDEHWSEGKEDEGETPATVATSLREDFMLLAYILDMAILLPESRRWTNRVLAASILFSVFEPSSLIEEVTGLRMKEIEVESAMEWLEPIIVYSERKRNPLNVIPCMEGIKSDSVHNIQLHRDEVALKQEIRNVIKEMERQRSEMAEMRGRSGRPTAACARRSRASRGAPIRIL